MVTSSRKNQRRPTIRNRTPPWNTRPKGSSGNRFLLGSLAVQVCDGRRFPTGNFPVQPRDMALYPLKFHPRLVEKMWGGRKIETVLEKPLPPGKPIGESWKLFDFPPGVVEKSEHWVSAKIANGPLAGQIASLGGRGEFGSELTGNVPLARAGQFPILIKFLDAREDLSVQVHPPRNMTNAHS